jgi:hypothetical protein
MDSNHKHHNPKENLLLRLGVIGHRVLLERGKLVQSVDRVLNAVIETFSEPDLAVITSLAEGSDRLVARRIMTKKAARLWVPLPLPWEEYLEDFSSPESQDDFRNLFDRAAKVIHLPEAPDRGHAYLQAGRYIINHCHVLIAVWDGQEAQGEGGTGHIAAEALQCSLPMAWIHAGNRVPGTEIPTSLGEEQGKVTYFNWPENSDFLIDPEAQER